VHKIENIMGMIFLNQDLK